MPHNLSPPPPPPSSRKTLTLDATLDLDLPSRIAELVLRHAHDDDPRSLALAISNLSPLPFPASLADAVLRSLWDHAPRALLFFRSLLHLPRRHDHGHGHGHLAPSASTFDLALNLAARLLDRRRVHSLLLLRRRLLPRLAPSPRTFFLLAERLVLSGKPDRSVRLFLSSPSSLHTPRTFNSLLDALSKSRRVHKATSLFKTLKHRFPPDAATYNVLAEGWCLLKRTSQALDLLRDMVASGVAPTKTTYNILLHGLFRARQTRQALDFFAQMKRRSKTDPVCAPDVVSYTTVLHALGLSGEISRAREVFDEMRQRGILPNVAAYNSLIQVICKKGTVDNALVVFDEMLSRGYTPNSTTYNVIIRGSATLRSSTGRSCSWTGCSATGAGPTCKCIILSCGAILRRGRLRRGWRCLIEWA